MRPCGVVKNVNQKDESKVFFTSARLFDLMAS